MNVSKLIWWEHIANRTASVELVDTLLYLHAGSLHIVAIASYSMQLGARAYVARCIVARFRPGKVDC